MNAKKGMIADGGSRLVGMLRCALFRAIPRRSVFGLPLQPIFCCLGSYIRRNLRQTRPTAKTDQTPCGHGNANERREVPRRVSVITHKSLYPALHPFHRAEK